MFTSFTYKSASLQSAFVAHQATGREIYRWQQKHIIYMLLIAVTYLVQQPRLNFAGLSELPRASVSKRG